MRNAIRCSVLAAAVLGLTQPALADTAETKGGLKIKTDDGRFEGQIEGRAMLDFAVFDNSDTGGQNVGGTEWRRVRIAAAGKLYGWEYLFEPDYSDDVVTFKDLWIATTLGPGKLTIGQFKQYFSIEELTSSRYITFMERSFLTQTLATSHQAGLGYQGAAGMVTFGVSGYNIDTNDAEANESVGAGARLTIAPLMTDFATLHFGLAGAQEHYGVSTAPSTGDNDRVRARVRVAGHMSDASRPTLMDLDNGLGVNGTKVGVEAAAVFGPFSVQGEYGRGAFEDEVEEGEISTYNVFLSVFLTGEQRPYDAKKGRFGQIKPKSDIGAFELALRQDVVNGEENPVGAPLTRDAEASALTFGVNWYLNPNVRFMLDYIDSEVKDELAGTTTDEAKAVTGRVQLHF